MKQLLCIALLSLNLMGCFMGGTPPAEAEYNMADKFQDRGNDDGGNRG